jgi:hypothetical protein
VESLALVLFLFPLLQLSGVSVTSFLIGMPNHRMAAPVTALSWHKLG